MAKIFIDVGGYKGHSVLAALDPIFNFDRVFCFEPSPLCTKRLQRIRDPRLVVVKAGLADEDGIANLFNSGTLAGSLFEDAPTYDYDALGKQDVVRIMIIDASRFLKIFTGSDDSVWMKLNCEGSEILVLNSLLANQGLGQFVNILIDLDALKIPSQKSKVEELMARVDNSGVSYCVPREVQYGMVTNYGGIHNWLLRTNALSASPASAIKSLAYNVAIFFREPECSGYHKMWILKILPWLSLFAKSRKIK